MSAEAAISQPLRIALVLAAAALVVLLGQQLAIQWRRRKGYRLPRREHAATVPSLDVRAFFPPFEQRLARLVAVPGRIEVDAYWRSRRLLTQTHGPVIEVRARFAPPWRRRAFVIRDDSAWCGVFGYARVMRLARETFLAAGFEIVEETTRFARFPIDPARYLWSHEAASEALPAVQPGA